MNYRTINKIYSFPVVTNQETNLKIPMLKELKQISENIFEAEHN